MEKKVNYEEVIDDEYQFPIFSEDPKEQNRLNVRHALKKAQSGMQLSEADSKLLIDNGLDDFVRGGQTQAAGVDAALIAAPFLAKPAILSGALTGTANLIKKYPMKSLEVGLTGLGAADYKDNPQDLVLETLGMKTDTMFTGGKTPSPFNPIATKKLASIIDDVFSQSPFAQTTDGINVPFFMSKSDDGYERWYI